MYVSVVADGLWEQPHYCSVASGWTFLSFCIVSTLRHLLCSIRTYVVTKGIVELHGGHVGVHSAGEGLGCTFAVELPVYFHSSPSPSISAHNRLPQGRAMFRSRPPPPLLCSDNVKNDVVAPTGSHFPCVACDIKCPPTLVTDGILKPNSNLDRDGQPDEFLDDIRSPSRIDCSRDSMEPEEMSRMKSHHRLSDSKVKAFFSPIPSPNTTPRADGTRLGDHQVGCPLKLLEGQGDVRGGDSDVLPVDVKKWHNEDLPSRVPVCRPSAARSIRALVVDDSCLNRKMMRRFLNGRCQTTEEASDGREALTEVRTALLAGRPYDVVLMDYNMPNLNGPEAARQLRSIGYSGLIVGITGMTERGDLDAFHAAGVDFVLTKPVNEDELDQLLDGEYSL